MTTAQEDIVSGITDALDIIGIDATYTPSGGAAKTIRIGFGSRTTRTQGSQLVTGPDAIVIIKVFSADVSNPQNGDTYVINGVTYYHRSVTSGGAMTGAWVLEVSKSARRYIG